MGEYFDGKIDCRITSCPIYSFMPYRELEPDLSCFDFNPKRRGFQGWEEGKELSEEHKAKLLAAAKEARENPKPKPKKKKKVVKEIQFKKMIKKRKKNNGNGKEAN
jgi:hypothetical protein